MNSNTFWDQLAIAEAGLVEGDRDANLSGLSAAPLAFFVHRSILTTTAELRSHQLWRGGNRIDAMTDPAALRVKIYLDHYGPLGTFTNLILEAEAKAKSRHRTVVLELSGAQKQSAWKVDGEVLTMTVSPALLTQLGVEDSCWTTIDTAIDTALQRLEKPRKPEPELPPAIATLIVSCRKQLQVLDSTRPVHRLSLLDFWPSEGEFFSALAYYFTGFAVHELPDETVLGTIRLWLRAIRATFLFRGLGTTWYTAPTKSPFADLLLDKLQMKAPLSSWSALTGKYEQNTVDALSDLVSARLQQNETKSIGPIRMLQRAIDEPKLPRLEPMKHVAASLIGTDHEGKPLNFTFLCCNDTEFLRWHVTEGETSAPKRWGLRIRQALSTKDFGSHQTGEKALRQVRKAIEGNSLMLQQDGYFLWFSPVVGTDGTAAEQGVSLAQYRPNAIVELVGDRMDREDLHRVVTETMKYAALIHIDDKQATLYQAGRRNETCDAPTPRGDWKKTSGEPLLDDLLTATQTMVINGATALEVAARVKKVMAAAEEVARQRHGALIFLWNGEPGNKTTPLSLAWGWASPNNYVELVDVATLAAAASLDGETVVNLATGAYSVRQFTHPHYGSQTMSFFDLKSGAIAEDLLTNWLAAPEAKDEPVDLWNFGTRHQKALRVTWSQFNMVIAVTVSASGPIRIWCNGKPIHKGKV